MTPRIGILIGALVAVIVAAVVAVLVLRAPGDAGLAASTSPSPSASDAADPVEESGSGDTGSDDASATPGAYADYSDDAVANADGRVLLFFHAPWCPQCRSVEADILADGVPAGVTILKVDFDSRTDLRQQYGVTLQTTFVEVDRDGAKLQAHVAYEEPTLDAVVAAML